MRRHSSFLHKILFLILALALVGSYSSASANAARRIYLSVDNKRVDLYAQSHALLIGVSNYKYWPSLESIPRELDDISRELKKRGFRVTRVDDPNGRQLQKALEDFVYKYGYDRKNRLLVYFAGHGHTIDGKGFLVPTDAVDPSHKSNEKDFKRKALNMSRILSVSREADARHIMFLFDSCFSGTIFKTRALPKISKSLNSIVAKPVRYFITAGSANEEVPAESVFAKLFVSALRDGIADLNEDDYITGRELGYFLRMEVPRFARQTPQSGTIDDYELSRGDMVFFSEGPGKRKKAASTKIYSQLMHQPAVSSFKEVGAVLRFDKQWNYVVFKAEGADIKKGDTVYLKSNAGQYVSVKVARFFKGQGSLILQDYQNNYEPALYVAN